MAVMAAGAFLLALALLADRIGVGAPGGAFGWKQMLGAMLGAGLLFGGARGWWEIGHPRGGADGGERNA